MTPRPMSMVRSHLCLLRDKTNRNVAIPSQRAKLPQRNGITERDGELLRRAMKILRHFHHFLVDTWISRFV